MQVDVYKILFNLPEGKAISVRVEEIAHQIKRDLFTGLDLMGLLRKEDVDFWVENAANNHGMKISHYEHEGIITFYSPELRLLRGK